MLAVLWFVCGISYLVPMYGEGFGLLVIPYLIFLAIGIFFGWLNLRSTKPSMVGNIITIIAIVMLLLPFFRG